MEQTIEALNQKIAFLENELKSARESIKRLTIENEKLIIDLHFLDKRNHGEVHIR